MSLRQNVIETFYRETLYLGNLFVGTIFLLDNYQGLITKGLITGRRSHQHNLGLDKNFGQNSHPKPKYINQFKDKKAFKIWNFPWKKYKLVTYTTIPSLSDSRPFAFL